MKWIAACALLAGATASFHAKADVWSYVDERGVTHFATSQLDARYEVFFRGMSGLAQENGPGQSVSSDYVPASTAKTIAYMESSSGYQQAQPYLRAAAQVHQVDYALLQALIATESGFDAAAVSPKGAVGLMQVIPNTAARYGVVSDKRGTVQRKLRDPRTNIQTGTRYLRDLLQMFPGQLDLALAAYNAGEGAVQRAGNRIPNYRETQNYVATVLQLYQALSPRPAPAQPVRPGDASAPTLSAQAGARGRGNMVPALAPTAGLPLAAAP